MGSLRSFAKGHRQSVSLEPRAKQAKDSLLARQRSVGTLKVIATMLPLAAFNRYDQYRVPLTVPWGKP